MRVIKLVVLVLVVLFLVGCSWGETKIAQHANYIPILCEEAPTVTPIITGKVHPRVVEDKYGIFWTGMTARDYENLSGNLQESIRYIKEQKAVSQYYKDCITDFNEQIKRSQIKADSEL